MTQSTQPARRQILTGSALAIALPLLGTAGEAVAGGAPNGATKKILDHHLGAFAKGLDEIMRDYSASSVILTHDKQFRGVAEIRGFFDGFLKSVKPGFWEAFKINAQSIDRDVIRGGKIVVQTFTAG
jgi:hypothetical protein